MTPFPREAKGATYSHTSLLGALLPWVARFKVTGREGARCQPQAMVPGGAVASSGGVKGAEEGKNPLRP